MSHTEMVTETYTEQVPKYKWVGYHECRKCGFQTEDDDAIPVFHIFDCDFIYTTKEKQVQDGFETVTKTRQVPKTVVDDPATTNALVVSVDNPMTLPIPCPNGWGIFFRCVARYFAENQRPIKKQWQNPASDLRCEILKENHGKFSS